jgi:hypothetical protein
MSCPCQSSFFLSTSLKYNCLCLYNSIKERTVVIDTLLKSYRNSSKYLQFKLKTNKYSFYKSNIIQNSITQYELLAVTCHNLLNFVSAIESNFIQCNNIIQIKRRDKLYSLWLTNYNKYNIDSNKLLKKLDKNNEELYKIEPSLVNYNGLAISI